MNLGQLGSRHIPAPVRRMLPHNRIEALLLVSCALSRHGYTDAECEEVMRQIDYGHPAVEALKQMGVGQ